MKEIRSILQMKVMELSITTMVISIKGCGRMARKKDMGYSYRMMGLYLKQNGKMAKYMVIIKVIVAMIFTQALNIKKKLMV